MKPGYGQYCPLALAVELLCERWTLLIVSRLIDGCTQFNEIQRGVPRITPAMLTKRLRELVEAGLVVSKPAPARQRAQLSTHRGGREFGPLIENLAVWGQNWARDMRTRRSRPGVSRVEHAPAARYGAAAARAPGARFRIHRRAARSLAVLAGGEGWEWSTCA